MPIVVVVLLFLSCLERFNDEPSLEAAAAVDTKKDTCTILACFRGADEEKSVEASRAVSLAPLSFIASGRLFCVAPVHFNLAWCVCVGPTRLTTTSWSQWSERGRPPTTHDSGALEPTTTTTTSKRRPFLVTKFAEKCTGRNSFT